MREGGGELLEDSDALLHTRYIHCMLELAPDGHGQWPALPSSLKAAYQGPPPLPALQSEPFHAPL